ncbi:MAG: alpha/beta hydrolase [Fodinibius sp.]|nr:alpha/beta hydrolase [Fodinibius sp.]
MRISSTAVTVLLFMLALTTTLYGQDRLAGNWKGAIEIQGTELTIITHFSMADDSLTGTLDIPQQGAQGLPFKNISTIAPDSVYFDFFAGMGMAEFRGAFKNDTTIGGTFHQSGQSFPFEINKQKNVSVSASKEDAPPSYNRKELLIQNDSVAIGGTLTWPKDTTTQHLVIMISGSGPQDRDATLTPVSDFKPFAVLADSLTMNNIATFRYDDRGIGQSSGNFGDTTLDMLASDVEAIIENLTAMPQHSFENIILLGHSQGGIVAGKVASENQKVDQIILMGSTGVPLKEVLRFQIKQAFAGSGVDSVLLEKEITAREQLMEAIRDQKGVQQSKEHYHKKFKAIQIAAGADTTQAEKLADRQTKQLEASFRSPQMQSLLFYDPAQDLQKLDIPVLVLFGSKDTQVPIAMNKKPIKSALDSADVSYQIWEFKQANHLFQKAKTGSAREYGSLEKQFVYPFTSRISSWIKKDLVRDK